MQRYSTVAPRIGKSRGGMKQPSMKRGLIFNAMGKRRARPKGKR